MTTRSRSGHADRVKSHNARRSSHRKKLDAHQEHLAHLAHLKHLKNLAKRKKKSHRSDRRHDHHKSKRVKKLKHRRMTVSIAAQKRQFEAVARKNAQLAAAYVASLHGSSV